MKPSIFDFIALAGFTLLLAGVERFSIAAALIVAGAALLYFGWVMSEPSRRRP